MISRALGGTDSLITRRDPLLSGRQRVPREGRAVGWGGPEAQVGQDLLDELGLFDEREDPHGSATVRTDERIHLVNLFDEPRPRALRGRQGMVVAQVVGKSMGAKIRDGSYSVFRARKGIAFPPTRKLWPARPPSRTASRLSFLSA